MIGCNQPKQDPVAVSLATDAAGSNKNITREEIPMCFGENPVIVNIVSMLREKSPEDLRLIYQIVQRL